MSDLTPDEEAILAKHRAERKAAEDDEEFEYEIWKGDAGARFSSKSKAGKQAKAFFKSLGIDLDTEPVQDDSPESEEDTGKPKPRNRQQAQPGVVKAFQRRIS